jgi:hypothetical protein
VLHTSRYLRGGANVLERTCRERKSEFGLSAEQWQNSALCFSKSLDKGGWIVVATVTEEQHETSHATSLIPFKMTPVAVRRPRGSILLFRSFRIRFRWVLSWALTIQRQSLGQPLHLLIDL